jgi:3D (Asp-Asp-Asp) domain-containing protein
VIRHATLPTLALCLAVTTPAAASEPAPPAPPTHDAGIMEVSAYCLRGRTASGLLVAPGTAAAARHVPFGTTYIVPGYGTATITDRGGAIWGNRLDLWFARCSDAMRWGRRWLPVTQVDEMGAA